MYHYIYVLLSLLDQNFYVGKTTDLEGRLKEHHNGYVPSTKNRRPLRLVYGEICEDSRDAAHREIYLKTAWGKRYLKERLKNGIVLH